MSDRYLLLHGWQHHRPPGHWLRSLAKALRDEGRLAVYPQLPSPDDPDLGTWLDVLDTELELLGPVEERVVVAHSLGVLLWLHRAERGDGTPLAARVLLVAPPGPSFTAEAVPGFALGALDGALVRSTASGGVRLACSDADPYCSEGTAATYGRALELETDVLPGQGHLTLDDGYGVWPAVLAWCQDGRVPLVAR